MTKDKELPSNTPSAKFKSNFFSLTNIINKVAQLALRYGCKVTMYGASNQMKNTIEVNGSITSGSLKQIVTYQNTFTSTTEARFSLSQDHKTSGTLHHPDDHLEILH